MGFSILFFIMQSLWINCLTFPLHIVRIANSFCNHYGFINEIISYQKKNREKKNIIEENYRGFMLMMF